jgi:hypothetical protein
MTSRTQLRDSLRNLYEIIDKYENDFRPDFLQGKYSDYVPSEDDTQAKDYWKADGEFCVVGWLAVNKDTIFPTFL